MGLGVRFFSSRMVECLPGRAAVAIVLASLAASAPTCVNAQGASRPDRIRIEYAPPVNPAHQPIYEAAKERKVLERIQELFSPFRLPVDLTIKIAGCNGVENAWYQRPAVTICYEYLVADVLRNLPKETTPAGITPTDALIGQFFYVVAHEMGHAMFDLLNVPLFGRPEDAADQFAAYIMLKSGKDEARRLIGGAAYAYQAYMRDPSVTVPITAFAGVHGAPMQRLYNILCIAYGADPVLFADVVDGGYLPRERARSCRVEYGEVNFAFQQLITPHLDQDLARKVRAQSWLPEAADAPTRITDQGAR